ncbi:Integrase, catalytic region [Halorhodospira halophila SL1]|uniref:Integrase, catalytic region n=1 Tax=Halorhodospira halophila (strain DSM 244 / SL1) TaxID=349124 RepID=A1WW59_HALHL|nr:Integrase, catalytic region [Halorhodospira halophila SL1]
MHPPRSRDRRCLIEPDHPQLSVAQQCRLLGLPRSTYDYRPVAVSSEELALMEAIDRQYLDTPWYGSRQMTAALRRRGWPVNRKRIQRLMRKMGLQAIAPGPHTSRKQPQHPVYPYLLRDHPPRAPNDAWAADITFVPMPIGFMYLVAIIDWHSRFVLAWELSNTLDTAFCLEALDTALQRFGMPGIFNTDQGTQFTSEAFTNRLKTAEVAISMDGRGRVYDNIFVERLWRSVKYELVYLHEFREVLDLLKGLETYFEYFNHRRPNQGLDEATPAEVYGLA